ncbi:MAG: hypothetical protein ACYCRM_01845 [Candidatus Dormibacteria bacterium]
MRVAGAAAVLRRVRVVGVAAVLRRVRVVGVAAVLRRVRVVVVLVAVRPAVVPTARRPRTAVPVRVRPLLAPAAAGRRPRGAAARGAAVLVLADRAVVTRLVVLEAVDRGVRGRPDAALVLTVPRAAGAPARRSLIAASSLRSMSARRRSSSLSCAVRARLMAAGLTAAIAVRAVRRGVVLRLVAADLVVVRRAVRVPERAAGRRVAGFLGVRGIVRLLTESSRRCCSPRCSHLQC